MPATGPNFTNDRTSEKTEFQAQGGLFSQNQGPDKESMKPWDSEWSVLGRCTWELWTLDPSELIGQQKGCLLYTSDAADEHRDV